MTTWDKETDIAVLGSGAAGMAAAIAGHDAGAETVVLEKMPQGKAGGNTRVSGGIWFNNVDASRAAVYLESLCGEYKLPPPVVRAWAEETTRNSEWLQGIGAKVGPHADYTPEYPELDGSDCYGGYMGIEGRIGSGLLYNFLVSAIAERGIDILYQTPAKELITDPGSGRVIGVVAERDGKPLRIRARRGVVIATGGFENNKDMVRDYLGLGDSPVWGSPAGTGDGHRMAMQIGADLWHMDNMMAIVGVGTPDFHAAFATMGLVGEKGYIFVGPDGSRYVNEDVQIRHGHARIHGRYELYPQQRGFVIFDERARKAGPLVPRPEYMPVGWNLVIENYVWSDDNLTEIEKGWIVKANTLPELAARLGIDANGLEKTVGLYNRYCRAGEDEQFGRPANTLIPLSEAPYYGFVSGPILAWSNGGPRRNEKSQVLNVAGEVIGGLYAAGTASSTYSWCKDGGFHIADALAFGRVAGRHAAAQTAN
ncbi:MAG TPA: FAD-dependent oxidoreductase [Alphaproteobacteria bacterium]|jgi:succinate dehydrogenase/fumarate reductase flavoprotein subunit|nr:FAD-dependent oxidoreductase [Alphaproteobacteria bacterium]